jgi:hypothetical protein
VSLPVWCVELSAAFWRGAGPPPPFPRDLTESAEWFGLTVQSVPGLTVDRVKNWFTSRTIPLQLAEPDRPLRGCLVAVSGRGFVFLDPADDPAEQRFTLAHEVAHFLRDYWHPREVVRRRLDESALAVLDGDRPPTPDERIRAVLRHVRVGPFAHLLARDDHGAPATDAERESEAAADRLAFELLAPADAVGDTTTAQLTATFGLPPIPAARYASLFQPAQEPVDRAWSRLLSGLKPG